MTVEDGGSEEKQPCLIPRFDIGLPATFSHREIWFFDEISTKKGSKKGMIKSVYDCMPVIRL